MTRFIANARMYAVAPAAEAAWRGLLGHIAADAGLDLDYLPYPAPAPLETLWTRPDLGAVFMCGYPIALELAKIVPIAAPIPDLDWAAGRARYRSNLIVRKDAPFKTLEETFGGKAGWTIAHSHSGFNAFRHHLLGYRSKNAPKLYREMQGNLVTARAILDAVREGKIDIGPLDAYWHALIARHAPDLVAGIRVLAATALAPMPAFVASPDLGEAAIGRLRAAFSRAAGQPWFADFADPLLLSGFEGVEAADFAPMLAWQKAAIEADYPVPA